MSQGLIAAIHRDLCIELARTWEALRLDADQRRATLGGSSAALALPSAASNAHLKAVIADLHAVMAKVGGDPVAAAAAVRQDVARGQGLIRARPAVASQPPPAASVTTITGKAAQPVHHSTFVAPVVDVVPLRPHSSLDAPTIDAALGGGGGASPPARGGTKDDVKAMTVSPRNDAASGQGFRNLVGGGGAYRRLAFEPETPESPSRRAGGGNTAPSPAHPLLSSWKPYSLSSASSNSLRSPASTSLSVASSLHHPASDSAASCASSAPSNHNNNVRYHVAKARNNLVMLQWAHSALAVRRVYNVYLHRCDGIVDAAESARRQLLSSAEVGEMQRLQLDYCRLLIAMEEMEAVRLDRMAATVQATDAALAGDMSTTVPLSTVLPITTLHLRDDPVARQLLTEALTGHYHVEVECSFEWDQLLRTFHFEKHVARKIVPLMALEAQQRLSMGHDESRSWLYIIDRVDEERAAAVATTAAHQEGTGEAALDCRDMEFSVRRSIEDAEMLARFNTLAKIKARLAVELTYFEEVERRFIQGVVSQWQDFMSEPRERRGIVSVEARNWSHTLFDVFVFDVEHHARENLRKEERRYWFEMRDVKSVLMGGVVDETLCHAIEQRRRNEAALVVQCAVRSSQAKTAHGRHRRRSTDVVLSRQHAVEHEHVHAAVRCQALARRYLAQHRWSMRARDAKQDSALVEQEAHAAARVLQHFYESRVAPRRGAASALRQRAVYKDARAVLERRRDAAKELATNRGEEAVVQEGGYKETAFHEQAASPR